MQRGHRQRGGELGALAGGAEAAARGSGATAGHGKQARSVAPGHALPPATGASATGTGIPCAWPCTQAVAIGLRGGEVECQCWQVVVGV